VNAGDGDAVRVETPNLGVSTNTVLVKPPNQDKTKIIIIKPLFSIFEIQIKTKLL
jgi:hypothetical protein